MPTAFGVILMLIELALLTRDHMLISARQRISKGLKVFTGPPIMSGTNGNDNVRKVNFQFCASGPLLLIGTFKKYQG